MRPWIRRPLGAVLVAAAVAVAAAGGIVVVSPSGPSPTPTATATATPSVGVNCMPDPSACGFPDLENTGIPAGTSMTATTGTLQVSAGQTITDRQVTGDIVLNGNNITLRRVRLICGNPDYCIRSFADNASGITVVDSEINLNGNNNVKGIAFNGYTLTRVRIWNGSDCAHFGSNVVIQDSLCTVGPDANNDGFADNTTWCSGPEHRDGFQSDGGENITIDHNTVRNNCGETSAILMSTNTSPINNVRIRNNLLAGGGYTVYCGQTGGVTMTSNLTITGNRFAKTFFPNYGSFGPAVVCNLAAVHGSNVDDATGADMGF